MFTISQSVILQSLGWALANSVWQFALLWLVYVVCEKTIFYKSAGARYNVGLLILFTGVMLFIGGFLNGITNATPLFQFFDNGINLYLSGSYNFKTWLLGIINYLLPFASAVYIVFICYLFIQFVRFNYLSWQLRRYKLLKADVGIRLFVEALRQQMSIPKKVGVWLSQKIDTPVVVGYMKPFILLPVAIVNQLTAEQLESILIHELAHIKRNDYFINLLVALCEIILCFNPFASLIIRRIKSERENSCDDIVMKFPFKRYTYASALLAIEKSRTGLLMPGVAASGNGKKLLLKRIQRIMEVKVAAPFCYKPFLTFCCLLLFIAFIITNPVQQLHPTGEAVANKNINFAVDSTATKTITIKKNLPASTKNKTINAIVSHKYAEHISYNVLPAINPNLLLHVNEQLDALETDQLANNAAEMLEKDYTIPDTEIPLTTENDFAGTYPYVPGKSFTYVETEDTVKPKVKALSYAEAKAKLEIEKTRAVLKNINWKKIENEFKNNKVALSELKAAIDNAVKEINWQRINKEIEEAAVIQQEKAEKDQQAVYELHKEMYLKQQQQMQHLEKLTQEKQRLQQLEIKKMMELRQAQNKKKIIYI
jgi:beta-lactamase regulating signal transducer with metallopeptidase domain